MNTIEWNPGTLLQTSGYYWKTCTLHAGVKLGVFTVIGKNQLSGKDVAAKVKGNVRAVTMLLNALAAMKLLKKSGGKYANTKAGALFLSKDSPHYIGFIITHHHHLIKSWADLDQAVLKGKPVRTRASFDNPEVRESFLMGMFNMAMSIAPGLSDKIDLSGRKHLLDLGGGPGTYAIHYCLKNPELKATIYDLPTTRPFAEKTIARFGVSNLISFMDGDYVKKTVRGTYDVAWLSHILHGESPKHAEQIIKKAVSVLEPGGMILIHEFILDNAMDGPLFPALFSLNMLLGTNGGQAYSEKDLKDMLKNAGAKKIKRLDFKGPTESGIISGIV